ncbi:hypothetical protein FBU30_006772 [Linnemannia zychae]|nr:hypothetical protein FBU30_006772 [Linnemannia zychae]
MSSISSIALRPILRRTFHLVYSLVLLCSFLVAQNSFKVTAQATTDTTTLSLSFQDSTGTSIVPSQSITRGTCIVLNLPAGSTFTSPNSTDDSTQDASTTNNKVTLVAASDQHAALNLYSDAYCQVSVVSTVGFFNPSNGTLVSVKAVRWEGMAPSDILPGTLNMASFPPDMTPQQLSPVNDDGTPKKKHHHTPEFTMDPSKGKFVVALVSVILAIGIVIGIFEVYKAAQYVPPTSSYGASRPGSISSGKGGVPLGVVGAKKVRKRDAYYRKPNPSTVSPMTATAANLNSYSPLLQQQQQQQQQQLSTSRSSMTTLATLRAAGAPGSAPAVLIEMYDTSSSSLSKDSATLGSGPSESSSLSMGPSSHSRMGSSTQSHIASSQSQPPQLEVLVRVQSSENKS